METFTIRIKDRKVLKLIYDLEDLNLIQVVDSDAKTTAKKPTEILSGSISTVQAEDEAENETNVD